ncbi:MAG: hypothetical protein Q8R88_12295 [Desulfoprunum sp.]|nr:hypothetical protein [Desulfoprunum sp.]
MAKSVTPLRASMMMALFADMLLLNEVPSILAGRDFFLFALPLDATSVFVAEEGCSFALWRVVLQVVFFFLKTTVLDVRTGDFILLTV